jgi:protein-L-isoaspartate(D-aspartate) O-methyltransferase
MLTAENMKRERARMVELLATRGIASERVLDAFRQVPREMFVAERLAEFAYADAPLPIDEEQTISQPFIVAVTVEALGLRGGESVLEVGTGSGYAAAILSRIASAVYSVERIQSLAQSAAERLRNLNYDNVHVLCGDGSLGWSEHGPYDAIAVAAGGPQVPPALLSQLAIGGRLVIPVGADLSSQVLLRVTRRSETDFEEEQLFDVRFVPLIGEQGWKDGGRLLPSPKRVTHEAALSRLVREAAEPIDRIETASVDALLERIGNARIVLLGESTHGTSEFYRMRARITEELIRRRGFHFVAVEADWPDAARVNAWVRNEKPPAAPDFVPFSRFPTWMWANEEIAAFAERIRSHNADVPEPALRVGFHGLDLYSMFTSLAAVVAYLDDVDPAAAAVARTRYASLTPWQKDPAAYGKAVLVGQYQSSEQAVIAILREMLARRFAYANKDGDRFFDAVQNARVVANAEQYYRAMYYGSVASWNLRDQHMFDTLQALLAYYGPASKGIVWEHNSHLGDARATEMGARGEHNVGQLCRVHFGESAYLVGFGTDRGTVAAASEWDGLVEEMQVRAAHPESYEHLFARSNVRALALHLRDPVRAAVRDELLPSRLERAIGVVYRPESELLSHYFQASLPRQFDEYIWFDQTNALTPIAHPF